MTGSFLTFLAVVLAIGAGVWQFLAWQRNQRNRDDLAALALAKGWQLLPPDPSLYSRWPGSPFTGGTNPRIGVVIGGTLRNRPFTAFEYIHDHVTRDSNGYQRRQTYHFTVCVVALPGYLAPIQVDPENAAERALHAAGWGQDQEFESEDFNRAFRVRTNHPKAASDLLSPRTMQLLVSRPHFSWRTLGTDVVTWADGIVDPMGLLARLDTVSAVIDGVPSFVWHDQGVDPSPALPVASTDPFPAPPPSAPPTTTQTAQTETTQEV